MKKFNYVASAKRTFKIESDAIKAYLLSLIKILKTCVMRFVSVMVNL